MRRTQPNSRPPADTARRLAWQSIAAARAHDPATRVPFFWTASPDAPRDVELGSVAPSHLSTLERWPQWLRVSERRVNLIAAPAPCTAALAEMNDALRAEGLIVGWRDESFPVYSVDGGVLGMTLERAAARFWGSLTLGAHCNGFVPDASGRPQRLWLARRAPNKATDPGKLDNLIGGGVPFGQTPRETVVREGWEEAGLGPEQMQHARPGRVMRVLYDTPAGLHREWVHVFDLALPPGLVPRNQDGEVASLTLHELPAALALAASGEMTIDASLATLDFALRHGALPADEHAALSAAMAEMWVENPT